jgi:cytochrome b6-f complex iron-sulfur subunit
VSLGGVPEAVVRTREGRFVAQTTISPNQGAVMNQSSTGFLCPQHGARFSATGAWVGGERTSSMRSFQTSYDAATGVLTVG